MNAIISDQNQQEIKKEQIMKEVEMYIMEVEQRVFYGRVNGSDEIGRLDVFMFLLDEDLDEDCDQKDCYKDYDYEDDNYQDGSGNGIFKFFCYYI
ncbi:MAG: hypothetical protein EZS28_026880 [Streblomastix strix]|uniref:Uncharacterized protein n=1 Tax=Streblomastix strix TaxID=222440 RepID=A0A5J4V4X3_9EUKA|nr:MAG: hypothetical protein EZS28_026880 [Streblomastix strix]